MKKNPVLKTAVSRGSSEINGIPASSDMIPSYAQNGLRLLIVQSFFWIPGKCVHAIKNTHLIAYFEEIRGLIGFLTLQFNVLAIPPFLSGGCCTIKTIAGLLLAFRVWGFVLEKWGWEIFDKKIRILTFFT